MWLYLLFQCEEYYAVIFSLKALNEDLEPNRTPGLDEDAHQNREIHYKRYHDINGSV